MVDKDSADRIKHHAPQHDLLRPSSDFHSNIKTLFTHAQKSLKLQAFYALVAQFIFAHERKFFY